MARLLAALTACLLFLGAVQARDGEALRAKHAALEQQLKDNPFGRPLYVISTDGAEVQKGQVHAVTDHPYAVVAPALQRREAWCAILMLQVNVKRCDPGAEAGLSIFATRHATDPVADAHRVDFAFEVAAAGEDYLRVSLHAPEGPFGTSNYRIGLEATPLAGGGTFLHMAYSYKPGWVARMGMRVYLAGSGRDKVGFSVVDRRQDGSPVYVDGVRGMIERNAMRYYVAIEAFLDALAVPPAQRAEQALRNWYAAIERHPLQLREDVSRDEYLRMKRTELGRRRPSAAAAGGSAAEWRPAAGQW